MVFRFNGRDHVFHVPIERIAYINELIDGTGDVYLVGMERKLVTVKDARGVLAALNDFHATPTTDQPTPPRSVFEAIFG